MSVLNLVTNGDRGWLLQNRPKKDQPAGLCVKYRCVVTPDGLHKNRLSETYHSLSNLDAKLYAILEDTDQLQVRIICTLTISTSWGSP